MNSRSFLKLVAFTLLLSIRRDMNPWVFGERAREREEAASARVVETTRVETKPPRGYDLPDRAPDSGRGYLPSQDFWESVYTSLGFGLNRGGRNLNGFY